jgi:hypothetical protein
LVSDVRYLNRKVDFVEDTTLEISFSRTEDAPSGQGDAAQIWRACRFLSDRRAARADALGALR